LQAADLNTSRAFDYGQRFSAAKYSFCSSSSLLTRPVTYVNSRTNLLSLIKSGHHTLPSRCFEYFDPTAKKLLDGEPPIEVATQRNPSAVPGAREGDPKVPESPEPDRIQIISVTLQPGEELFIARRLREVLREARKAA